MTAAAYLLPLLLILAASEHIPRLKFTLKDLPQFTYETAENYSVFFHDEGTDKLYIGGTGAFYIISFPDPLASPIKVNLNPDDNAKDSCISDGFGDQGACENTITVIQRLNASTIILCGTHVQHPKCWFLRRNSSELATDAHNFVIVQEGDDISPYVTTQRVTTIAVEGNLYSGLSSESTKGSIKRSYGKKRHVKTMDGWLQNPTFVSSALIQGPDSSKGVLYFFFSESTKPGLDSAPYTSHVGRVCKMDEGGTKNLLSDTWTTFLRARLVCGFAKESRYFNKLEDAFVVGGKADPKDGILFGIFTSLWNSTAICVYSVADIDKAFKESKLEGYSSPLPTNRPGTCVSPGFPLSSIKNTMNIIKDHPKIEQHIYPSNGHPLYVTRHSYYTRLVVDRVKAASGEVYNVLFIGTENGRIHKVLQNSGRSFIIAELRPFSGEESISALTLDTLTGHLYVGSRASVARLPLADCTLYGESCRVCVAARDPYCGWDLTSETCAPVTPRMNSSDFLQSVDQLNISSCESVTENKVNRKTQELTVVRESHVYLPCPVRSYHATYTWSCDGGGLFSCIIKDGSCPLVFGGEHPVSEGLFTCVAEENGLPEALAVYKIKLSSVAERLCMSPALLCLTALLSLI